MARPNNSDRTREQIVDSALALVDAEGLAALSMRRLARECGIRGPTLYHYFADKEVLLGSVMLRVVDAIWSGVDARLADVDRGDWAAVLRGYVEGSLEGMAAHPNLVGMMALTPVSSRRTLEGYEAMLGRLTACGWTLGFSWQVFLAAENLMISAALEAGAPDFMPAATEIEGLPLLGALLVETARDPSLDDGYPIGLEALISGVEATLGRQPEPAEPGT